MSAGVDTALIEALGLDANTAKMSTHGGSGFASTFKVSGTKNGRDVKYFVKMGTGSDAELMFRGEHASLNAIHNAVPSFCPASHAHGALTSKPGTFFLATDFLDLSASRSTASAKGTNLSLAAKLAKLHTTPAPILEGHSRPMFGFPYSTCCGATPQDNTFSESWPDFYANARLRHILRAGAPDAQLSAAVERVADKVVPRLLGAVEEKGGITPVVVHGDLWSGNHGTAGIKVPGGDGDEIAIEEVVFDPSCVYGHSEYELGIMRMFGGFGSDFWKEYKTLMPPAEPADEWEDRVALYELYHHLNHYAIFGGSYKSGALAIMKKLISKYG